MNKYLVQNGVAVNAVIPTRSLEEYFLKITDEVVMMLTLIQIELYKIFKKWRTYIGFIAIGILVPIIHIAMVFEGQDTLNFMTRNIQQSFIFVGNLLNGYLVSYLILTSLAVHIPFLIALVTGDLLAGEATAGTYRMLITRPISRTQIITSKFFAGIIYTNLLILWLALMSLVVGLIIFGSGELLVISNQTVIILKRAIYFGGFFLLMVLPHWECL